MFTTLIVIVVLLITEEVHVCTSQRTISTCVMHYSSKFDQEVNPFINCVDYRKKTVGNSKKWSRSLKGAVVQMGFTMLVVTRAGHL